MGSNVLLYISMLGEPSLYDENSFRTLCPTGLEKDWISMWHGGAAQEFKFRLETIDICRGDQLPDAGNVQAAILGGTAHVIDEDRPWLIELTRWLRKYRALKRPLLAICGGHQLVATKLWAGTLAHRLRGTLAGTYPITLTTLGKRHPLFYPLLPTPRFHFANYLHVLLPPDFPAATLAVHEDSPAIALDYGHNWFSCQFHPESRKDMWDCFYQGRSTVRADAFTDEHAGWHLVRNYLSLAAAACGNGSEIRRDIGQATR